MNNGLRNRASFARHLRMPLVLCAWLAVSSIASACPMCKEALSNGGGDLVSGFFYSILFMLSMPFLIVGGLGTYMYLLVRRARSAEEAAQANTREPVGVA